jgi:DNA-directed RNA polymerase subunit RPC12/RpoP
MAQYEYTCQTCGETFETGVELEEHNRMVHSQYKCEICGQTFGSESELETHNLVMHPERQGTPKSW